MPSSAYFWPSLTTINYNHHELGCRAVQELVKQIEAGHRKEQVEPQTILLLPDLVLRGSSVKYHCKMGEIEIPYK